MRRRAAGRCEYCRTPDAVDATPFHLEHIVARQHGGKATSANLAWSCSHCNAHKGPNLSGVDPATGAVVLLFNPRRDRRADHFARSGAEMVGLTPVGRATVATLAMNDRRMVLQRSYLIAEGLFDL